jgi:hypothetical protein
MRGILLFLSRYWKNRVSFGTENENRPLAGFQWMEMWFINSALLKGM